MVESYAPTDNLTRSEVMDWRNAERLRIVETLTEQLPALQARIGEVLDTATVWKIALPRDLRDKIIGPMVQDWISRQKTRLRSDIALSAAENDRQTAQLRTKAQFSWEDLLATGAGTIMTVAPVAAVPFVVTMATVTTTSLFVFSTAAVSVPVLSVFLVGGLALSLGGYNLRRSQVQKWRTRFRQNIFTEVFNQIIGDPVNPASPSLCRNLLAEVDKVARLRMESCT